MSAVIGKAGLLTVSVGDGGTVYLGDIHGDYTFDPDEAIALADLLERAAVHREPDPRTRLERLEDQLARAVHDLYELTKEGDEPPPF